VQALPNVTVLDVSQSIRQIAGALDRFSQAMRFFTLFSMAAGILLVVSSIIATRAARIREAVYYKILGAPGRFVLYVFSLENLLLGGASAAGGLLLAHLISWVVCVRYFDIAYQPYPAASLAGLMVGILAVVLVGFERLAQHHAAQTHPISAGARCGIREGLDAFVNVLAAKTDRAIRGKQP
jgi:putative ABC transport system permease protein